jgi:anti-sigma B factor antagonist
VIQAAPFELHSELGADGGRITVSGELDIASVPQVEEAVQSLLAKRARRLVIDLIGMTFIDSSGLRMLIGLSNRAEGEGWTLALLRPEEPSLSVFQITGADENLPFIEERRSR